MPEASTPIAVILKGYPRLSETFIAQELLGLEQRGLTLHLYALRQPTDPHQHPIHKEIKANVTYLPEYLHHAPLTVLKAWLKVRHLPGYSKALRMVREDLKDTFSRQTCRRFGQACILASLLPKSTPHLYAHFLHSPASVTRYAAALLDLPWSVSAHAKDIWTQNPNDIKKKLKNLKWLTTCTKHAHSYLKSLTDHPEKIHLTFHGLDLNRFPIPSSPSNLNTSVLRLLSIGRLVEKKGYHDLLIALKNLPHDLKWSFTHLGGGPLKESLMNQASSLGLSDHILWKGPQAHDQVLDAYRHADVFVLPCIQTKDGDQDGLPNVLLEAQSQRLFCISTNLSGIPELIIHKQTGLLVDPQNPHQLGEAILWAARHPNERMLMAQAGQARVHNDFGMDSGLDHLTTLLKGS